MSHRCVYKIGARSPALAAIYFNTIHNINSKDYSSEQIDAWAPRSSLETEGWMRKWQKLQPLVATINDKIVGFAEPAAHLAPDPLTSK